MKTIVATAVNDNGNVAAWEMRQKPYEHPKFYDPVTGLTNWNSHACVLIRRSAFEKVGGYDKNIFMYGDDVELSYRLRDAGYLLKYCPRSVVHHYTYKYAGQVKPIQYTGSLFANLYLRIKYGSWQKIALVPLMMIVMLFAKQPFDGSRKQLLLKFFTLFIMLPGLLAFRMKRNSAIKHPFRSYDYDIVRHGSFAKSSDLPTKTPLVTIITRTISGRDLFLKQAFLSVAHQTYPSIEYIIVQDGGDSASAIVKELNKITGINAKFVPLKKLGRSVAGNKGLENANGKWCLFLDDDDLLFSDHVETLVDAISNNKNAVAAYAPAMEIKTKITKKAEQVEDYYEAIQETVQNVHENFSTDKLANINYFPIQTVLFERNLFTERGGFDEDLDTLEDWLLWYKYAQGNIFTFVEKSTSIFRTPFCAKTAIKRSYSLTINNKVVKSRIKQLKFRAIKNLD